MSIDQGDSCWLHCTDEVSCSLTITCSVLCRLQQVFHLIRSTEQAAGMINVQITEHYLDTCTINVILKDIQHDTKCDKGGSLIYRYNEFILPLSKDTTRCRESNSGSYNCEPNILTIEPRTFTRSSKAQANPLLFVTILAN